MDGSAVLLPNALLATSLPKQRLCWPPLPSSVTSTAHLRKMHFNWNVCFRPPNSNPWPIYHLLPSVRILPLHFAVLKAINVRLVQLSSEPGQVPVNVPSSLSSSRILQRPQGPATEAFLDPDELTLKTVKKGKMHLLRPLSSGSFGSVYAGLWRGERVASKQLNDDVTLDRQTRLLLRNEANLCIQLCHPHIITTWASFTEEDEEQQPCLVMEMMPLSLAKVLGDASVTLEAPTQIRFAFQVACGMQYLHSQQPRIVHRDLKPANVLVDEALRTCKIIDFGLASAKDSQKSSQKSGKEKGTLAFMAPELYDEGGSRAVDYYAYGMFTWNVFTRSAPFADKTAPMIYKLVHESQRPDLSKIHLPWMCDIITQCWKQVPKERMTFAKVIHNISLHATKEALA
eukprot:m.210932 g.210932  ORF g.210932 m.210932 type:complete len:400 (+) comp26132_c6_seq7:2063-3262(+)